MADELDMYVVYVNPRDYPEAIVARRHVVTRNGCLVDIKPALVAGNIDTVRQYMEGMGLKRMSRHPDDDPVIAEIWL